MGHMENGMPRVLIESAPHPLGPMKGLFVDVHVCDYNRGQNEKGEARDHGNQDVHATMHNCEV